MALIENFGPQNVQLREKENGLGRDCQAFIKMGMQWLPWTPEYFGKKKEETYANRDDFDPKNCQLRHKKGGK